MSKEYLESFVKIVEEAIKRKSTTALKSSSDAINNPYMVRNMKLGNSPSIDNAKKLCDALGLEFYIGFPEDSPKQVKAPLFGSVKEGQISSSYDLSAVRAEELHKCEQISAPVTAGGVIAIKASDNSLSHVFNEGDLLFAYLHDRSDSKKGFEACIGKICLIQTQEATWVRILRRGDTAGKWNLESVVGGNTLTDQELTVCIPVRWISKA